MLIILFLRRNFCFLNSHFCHVSAVIYSTFLFSRKCLLADIIPYIIYVRAREKIFRVEFFRHGNRVNEMDFYFPESEKRYEKASSRSFQQHFLSEFFRKICGNSQFANRFENTRFNQRDCCIFALQISKR